MCRIHTLLVLAIIIVTGHSRVATAQIKEASSATATFSGQVKALAIYAPPPEYPPEARRNRLTGSGVALLEIDKRTGYVTSAKMLQSMGHKVLDDAVLDAFRRWRFRPGTVSSIRIPMKYTINGRFYD
jgi:TonB family protein